jgi:hypothetical protein
MPHRKKIRTTLAELATALFEAALAEVKNEAKAARIAEQMMREALHSGRVHIA